MTPRFLDTLGCYIVSRQVAIRSYLITYCRVNIPYYEKRKAE